MGPARASRGKLYEAVAVEKIAEQMTLSPLEVRIRRSEEIEESIGLLPDEVSLVTFRVMNPRIVAEIGAYELLDLAEEHGLKTSSVKISGADALSDEDLEKTALMAGETETRSVILEVGDGVARRLGRLFDTFTVNRARVLLDPPPSTVGELYNEIREYIGGVFWLSLSEERFPDTWTLISTLNKYFRLVKSISITNVDEKGIGRPILKPGKYNNPALIRHALERGYDEEIILSLREPLRVEDEYPAFKEYIRGIEEKVSARTIFASRGKLHF